MVDDFILEINDPSFRFDSIYLTKSYMMIGLKAGEIPSYPVIDVDFLERNYDKIIKHLDSLIYSNNYDNPYIQAYKEMIMSKNEEW